MRSAYYLIQENTYPKGHPYSWTVIGSMEDLNAASLDDVKDWFKTYYGAAERRRSSSRGTSRPRR